MNRIRIALAATAVAAVAAAPAAAREQAARDRAVNHSTVLHKCVSGTAVAPRTYVLACADGNTWLQRLHWSHWGSSTATATGSGVVNSCTPSCAAGEPLTYAVTVTASHPAHGAYGRLVVTATGKRPHGVAKRTTYTVRANGPTPIS